jgi:hypothetical protein
VRVELLEARSFDGNRVAPGQERTKRKASIVAADALARDPLPFPIERGDLRVWNTCARDIENDAPRNGSVLREREQTAEQK